jgi:hypothetical protein
VERDLLGKPISTLGPGPKVGCSWVGLRCRSVAQSGSAPRSGRGGRRFKSCHSDQTSCRHFSVLSRRDRRPQARPGTVIGTETAFQTLAADLRAVTDRNRSDSERPKSHRASRRPRAVRDGVALRQVGALVVGRRLPGRHRTRDVASQHPRMGIARSARRSRRNGHRRRDGLALRQERLSGSRSRAGWQEEACRWFALVLVSFLGWTMTPSKEAILLDGKRRHAPLRTEARKRSGRGPRPLPRPTRRNPQAPGRTADHALAVYDGQHRVGWVVAFDVHDRRVGVFTNHHEALRAIPAARSS